jgi:Ca2+/Na+ antiporter
VISYFDSHLSFYFFVVLFLFLNFLLSKTYIPCREEEDNDAKTESEGEAKTGACDEESGGKRNRRGKGGKGSKKYTKLLCEFLKFLMVAITAVGQALAILYAGNTWRIYVITISFTFYGAYGERFFKYLAEKNPIK